MSCFLNFGTGPPIFARIASGIKSTDNNLTDAVINKTMFNTYNMGIGFVLALAPQDVQKAAAFLEDKGFPAWEIGRAERTLDNNTELRFV